MALRFCFILLIFFSSGLWGEEKTALIVGDAGKKAVVVGDNEKNSLIVCDNGLEMFGWDLEFLSHAEHSVEALVCFFGGSTARTLLAAMEKRIEEVAALQVYLLASPVMMAQEDWITLNRLKSRFPKNFHVQLSTQVLKIFPDVATIDNHVKLFIVDEHYFSAGGTNFEEAHCSNGTFTPDREKRENVQGDSFLPAGMRDQDVVGRGPLAKELRYAFFQYFSLWEDYNRTKRLREDPHHFSNNAHYFPLIGPSLWVDSFENFERKIELERDALHCIFGGPHQKSNAITEEYVRLIRLAKEEILISHLYFFPAEPIFQALLEAVNRGVKVTILTNGLDEHSCEGAKLFAWANRLSYVPLFYGRTFHIWDYYKISQLPLTSCEIYEYAIPNVVLHKKTMLVDRKYFLVGSYNLGTKSAMGDYELVLSINSPDVAEAIFQIHLIDRSHSRRVAPDKAVQWYFDPLISSWGELQKRFGGLL